MEKMGGKDKDILGFIKWEESNIYWENKQVTENSYSMLKSWLPFKGFSDEPVTHVMSLCFYFQIFACYSFNCQCNFEGMGKLEIGFVSPISRYQQDIEK